MIAALARVVLATYITNLHQKMGNKLQLERSIADGVLNMHYTTLAVIA